MANKPSYEELEHKINILDKSLRRYRDLYESSPLPYHSLDKDGFFVNVNPAWLDLLGYSKQEVIGKNYGNFLHPDWEHVFATKFPDFVKTGEVHDVYFKIRHKAGHYIDISLDGCINTDDKGSFLNTNCVFTDISERIKIQSDLEKSEERFRQIAKNSQMWIWEVNASGLYTFSSSSCEALLGYKVESIVGKKYFYDFFHPDDKEQLKAEGLKGFLAKKSFNKFPNRNVSKTGEVVWLSTSGVPMIGDNGELLGYRGVDIDITEQKKLLFDHARSAQLVALGTVAAGVAHEINNPINGIINYATLLKSRADDPNKVLDLSQRVLKESERIEKITKNLLHYSKDNRNETRIVNAKEMIEGALSLIVPKIRPSGVQIETILADSLPALKVNPQSIQQIIINLVENAYDALRYKDTPNDEKFIRVTSSVFDKKGQKKFCIEVTDNGIGMSHNIVRKAKEAFFSTKPSSEGTGLGLSIVSEIVSKHQGEFFIESKEGEYTKINIHLPFTGDVS